jgi:hypothetical protein
VKNFNSFDEYPLQEYTVPYGERLAMIHFSLLTRTRGFIHEKEIQEKKEGSRDKAPLVFVSLSQRRCRILGCTHQSGA